MNATCPVLQCLCDVLERLNYTARFLLDFLSCAFSFQNLTLLEAFSYVDFGLSFTFGVEDFAPLNALAFCLQLHRPLYLFRRFDVLDFVAHAVNTPLLARIVQTTLDVDVQVVSLFERAVQVQETNFRTHRSLS